MFGAIVIVQFESKAPVYLIYIALAWSVEPSATVLVWVLAFVVMASVPKPNASPISSRFVLVVVPQVPEPSPVPNSLSLKSFT